jgi:hypothetical protein
VLSQLPLVMTMLIPVGFGLSRTLYAGEEIPHSQQQIAPRLCLVQMLNTIKFRSELNMVCRREKARFARVISAVMDGYYANTINIRPERTLLIERATSRM